MPLLTPITKPDISFLFFVFIYLYMYSLFITKAKLTTRILKEETKSIAYIVNRNLQAKLTLPTKEKTVRLPNKAKILRLPNKSKTARTVTLPGIQGIVKEYN